MTSKLSLRRVSSAVEAGLHDRRAAYKNLAGDDYDARVAPLREQLRAATLDGGDLRAAHARLTSEGAKKGDWHARDEMMWAAALLDCLEASEVPTEEKLAQAEAAAPVKDKKKRGGKPRKPKAPTVAWTHKLGKGGTRLVVPVKQEFLVRAGVQLFGETQIQKFAFTEGGPVKERIVGTCLISFAGDTDFIQFEKWIFGEFVVFGWRVDARKVPGGTMARKLEAAIREEEKRLGRMPGKELRKSIKADVRDTLLRAALPQTTVYPVLWAPAEGWALVDGPAAVVEEVRLLLGAKIAALDSCLSGEIRGRLAACRGETYQTDLRRPAHPEAPASTVDVLPVGVLSDFLLWLATPGTAHRSLAWILKDQATWKLSGGPVKLRVPVGNSSNNITLEDADSGALPASLAEGGRLMALRLEVEDRQEVPPSENSDEPTPTALVHSYHLSLEVVAGTGAKAPGLRVHSVGLPTVKGGDSAEALVFERVTLHKRLWFMLQSLFSAFASDRCQDWQPVADAARKWVGLELVRRYVFDERTGQGWLFGPVGIAAESMQGQIEEIEAKNAEAPKSRKGRGKGK